MLEKALKWMTFVCMLVLVLGCVHCSILRRMEAPQRQATPPEEIHLAGKDSGTIPRLYLEGPLNKMEDKSDTREIFVEYQDELGSFKAYAKLNVQGGSSLDYEKKNYNIQFFSDKNHSLPSGIDFGWGAQSKYCLKANWVDRTHARNIVSARLTAQVQARYGVLSQTPNHGVTDGYPIEVYANGAFLGLYTLNIPRDAWMLGMDEENENHLALISYTWEPSAMFEALPNYQDWGVEVGKKDDKTLETFGRLFEFVMESSDEAFREQQPEYFDLDAALNYIILCELGLMVDNSVKNMIFLTYDGQVWIPSLYDMDSTWGVDWSGRELYSYTYASITSTSDFLKRVKRVFTEELVERYFELRKDLLTKEHIMELFRDFESSIPADTWEKERQRWQDIPGYGYEQIEQFLDVRLPWLDEDMRRLLKEE